MELYNLSKNFINYDSLNMLFQDITNPVFYVYLIFVGVVLLGLIIGLIIYVNKHKPIKKYLNSHDNNIRHFKYDSKNGTMTFFDSKDSKEIKTISIDEFYSMFSYKPMEADRVKEWLESLLVSNEISYMLRTQIKLKKYKNVRETFLKVDNVNKETGIIHFESQILSNSYLMKHRLKNLQLSNIITYDTYLKNFRLKMFRTKPCQFYFIGLKINSRYALYSDSFEKEDSTIKLLGEYFVKNLNKSSFLVYVDNLSIMIIDTKPSDEGTRLEEEQYLKKHAQLFLSINNLDTHYSICVGYVYHEKDTPILPLNDYRVLAEKDALTKYNSIYLIDKYRGDLVKQLVENRTYRVYFNPIFDFTNGNPIAYIVNVSSNMLSNNEISMAKILEIMDSSGYLERFAEDLYKRIKPRIKIGPPNISILIPIPITIAKSFDAIWNRIDKSDLDAEFKVILSESELSTFYGEDISLIIEKLNKSGMETGLMMMNKPSIIVDSVLQLFSFFIISKQDGNKSLVTDLPSRAYTLSCLNSLAAYDKPIYFDGLNDIGECYFTKIHGINYGDCTELCPPSSYLEVLDIRGMGLIEKLNSTLKSRK